MRCDVIYHIKCNKSKDFDIKSLLRTLRDDPHFGEDKKPFARMRLQSASSAYAYKMSLYDTVWRNTFAHHFLQQVLSNKQMHRSIILSMQRMKLVPLSLYYPKYQLVKFFIVLQFFSFFCGFSTFQVFL